MFHLFSSGVVCQAPPPPPLVVARLKVCSAFAKVFSGSITFDFRWCFKHSQLRRQLGNCATLIKIRLIRILKVHFNIQVVKICEESSKGEEPSKVTKTQKKDCIIS